MARRIYGYDAGINSQEMIIENKEPDRKIVKKSTSKITIIIVSIIGVILLCLSCYFGYQAYTEHKQKVESHETWNNIKSIAYDNSDINSDINSDKDYFIVDDLDNADNNSNSKKKVDKKKIDKNMLKKPNFKALKKENSDVSAWIYIPNTNIDYPVLQEPVYNQYKYLHADIYGRYTEYGSIFMPAEEKKSYYNTDAHKIIYGHNMQDGTMFSNLLKYKDESFYKNNPYVYIYYPDWVEKWEIWTASNANTQSDVYKMPYKLGSKKYKQLLSDLNKSKYYDTNISRKIKDLSNINTLVLSTCDWTYGDHNGRFLLNCIKKETMFYN